MVSEFVLWCCVLHTYFPKSENWACKNLFYLLGLIACFSFEEVSGFELWETEREKEFYTYDLILQI